MKESNKRRRQLLKGTLGSAAAAFFPADAFSQSGYRIRLEWQQFKKTSQCQSFLSAISLMRRNTNPSDPGSLQFWANVHQNFCPHSAPYFISWHRGYLYYFEQQLRIASRDPSLNLPYWDYFSYPTLPSEFTNPDSSNPLYLQRMGANVYNALDLSPFVSGVYNFQRGTLNAFEPKIENAPHNPVHDLIGGIMSTMQSPLDPIFYLHHANIDRLTHAWALPDGKGIPLSAYPYSSTNSDVYWAGNNIYATDLTLERYKTVSPTWLGIDYGNDKVPASLPPLSVTAKAGTIELPMSPRLPSNKRPVFKSYTPTAGYQDSSTRRSLGGASQLVFDEQSSSLVFGLTKNDSSEVARAINLRQGTNGATDQKTWASIKLVIDRPLLSGAGSQGGYFYALYLNMPPVLNSQSARDRSFLGTLGAFQIAGASHHGPAKLEFDLSDLLSQQKLADFSELSLSWIRVDGDNPPLGKTINVDEARLELSYETEPIQAPPLPRPTDWYRNR